MQNPEKLEKNKKHTIEVVVDRFKVRPDIQQRIAESFETCLTLTDGIAVIARMNEEEEQEEIFGYFMESETDDIDAAIDEFDGDYDDEELRLYRIKFISEVAN